MKILIFSDLHIGSRTSTITVADVRKIVNAEKPFTTIFAGDTVDLMADPNGWSHTIHELCCLNYGTLFFNGNHDRIHGIDQVTFKDQGRKIKIFHGDQFETSAWVTKLDPYMVKINEFCLKYLGINPQAILRYLGRKAYPEGYYVPRLYDQRERLIEAHKGHNVIISGHTHYAEVTKISKDMVYANPGDHNSYLVLEDGRVTLKHR